MLDWTSIIIAAIFYGTGLAHQWLRLRHDVQLGRSLRPSPPNKKTLSEKE